MTLGKRIRIVDPFEGQPIAPGNVDLYRQPVVRNKDGTVSTVDSAGYNLDGRETLLPSVTPDGRHLSTDDDIIAEYRKSGLHLGQFRSVEDAERYAQQLHEDYARGRFNRARTVDPFAVAPLGTTGGR